MNGHKTKELRKELFIKWLELDIPNKLPFKSVFRRRKKAYMRGMKKLAI